MKKTRHTTDQIIEKLRQADIALGKGQKVSEICKILEITEQTSYRWRQKYGGLQPDNMSDAFGFRLARTYDLSPQPLYRRSRVEIADRRNVIRANG